MASTNSAFALNSTASSMTEQHQQLRYMTECRESIMGNLPRQVPSSKQFLKELVMNDGTLMPTDMDRLRQLSEGPLPNVYDHCWNLHHINRAGLESIAGDAFIALETIPRNTVQWNTIFKVCKYICYSTMVMEPRIKNTDFILLCESEWGFSHLSHMKATQDDNLVMHTSEEEDTSMMSSNEALPNDSVTREGGVVPCVKCYTTHNETIDIAPNQAYNVVTENETVITVSNDVLGSIVSHSPGDIQIFPNEVYVNVYNSIRPIKDRCNHYAFQELRVLDPRTGDIWFKRMSENQNRSHCWNCESRIHLSFRILAPHFFHRYGKDNITAERMIYVEADSERISRLLNWLKIPYVRMSHGAVVIPLLSIDDEPLRLESQALRSLFTCPFNAIK